MELKITYLDATPKKVIKRNLPLLLVMKEMIEMPIKKLEGNEHFGNILYISRLLAVSTAKFVRAIMFPNSRCRWGGLRVRGVGK